MRVVFTHFISKDFSQLSILESTQIKPSIKQTIAQEGVCEGVYTLPFMEQINI